MQCDATLGNKNETDVELSSLLPTGCCSWCSGCWCSSRWWRRWLRNCHVV